MFPRLPPLNDPALPGLIRGSRVLLALCIGLWCAPASPGSERSLARVDQLHDTLMAAGAELANQLAAARAELDAPAPDDGWTDDARVAARTWLDGLTQPRFPTAPQAAELLHPTHFNQVQLKSTQIPTMPPTALRFAEKVAARLKALRDVRTNVWYDYTEAVADAAESVWMDATKPADLAPALKILDRFKAVALDPAPAGDPNRVERPFPTPSEKVDGHEIRMSDDEALAALVLMSGPEPLILPDPLVDPAAYREMRMRWHNLAGWHLRFCERWQVAQRVREYDQRYRQLALRAQGTLERRIAADAPAGEITAALANMETFRNSNPMNPQLPFPIAGRPPIPPVPSRDPPEPKPRQSALFFPADYRALLDEPGGERPGPIVESAYFRPAIEVGVIDNYRTLVKLLLSETPEKPPEFSSLAGASWYRHSIAIRTRVQIKFGLDAFGRRIPAPPKSVERPNAVTVPAPPPGESPYEAVRISLEAAALGQSEFSQAAKTLLPFWKGLKDANGNPNGPAALNEALWSTLASAPGGPALIAARDRAVLALLKPSAPPLEGPVLPVLRQHLEVTLGAGDATACRRLLDIDQAASLLPPNERKDWNELLQFVAGGRQTTSGVSAFAPRQRVSELLARIQDPAAVRAILDRLKTPPKP